MKGTILIFSPVHWNSPWEISHSIATAFAKYGYDLVFIEPIPKRWPKLAEAERVFGRLFGRSEFSGHAQQQPPHENIHIYSPICLPDTGALFRRLNLAWFLKRIKNDLLRLIRQQPIYGLNFTPVSLAIALMENLPIEVRGYFCVSDWQNHPFIKTIDVFEKEMLDLADIAWADSPYLYEKIRQSNSNTKQVLPAISAELIDLFASSENLKFTAGRDAVCHFWYDWDSHRCRSVS